MSQFLHLK